MGASTTLMNSNGNVCIHLAAQNGNVAVINCLINCCPEIDVNQRDHKGTPLIIATKSRNFKTVEKLIWGKANIDVMDDNGDTPLHWATLNGDARLVSFLACTAQLTSRNNKGRTALALAARLGYGEIFKILLDKGADIHTTDNSLRTIMHQACIAEGTEILKYVLTTPLFTAPSFVPDNDKGESALHYACRIGNKAAVAVLLHQEVQLNSVDLKGRTPLLLAISKGRSGMAITLLNTWYADGTEAAIDWPDYRGNTPLHECMRRDDVVVAKQLLNRGADYLVLNTDGDSPLTMLNQWEQKESEVFELLLSHALKVGGPPL